MPVTTKLGDVTLTEYSPEETARSVRICGEVAERMGRDFDAERDDSRPSIQSVSHVVAWAFAYAPAERPLDESHPQWTQFFHRSEWFREQILQKLSLPADTSWEEIYRIAGFLVDEEYESEEKFWEAHHFGQMTRLEHPDAARKLEELEWIKFQIVGRL